MSKKLIAVYGSLRRGLGNHSLLTTSDFKGEEWSPEGYKMFSLGAFPGVIEDKKSKGKILLELYEVEPHIETRLDMLEGYYGENNISNFYNKAVVATTLGEAIIYLINSNNPNEEALVKSGDWKEFTVGSHQ